MDHITRVVSTLPLLPIIFNVSWEKAVLNYFLFKWMTSFVSHPLPSCILSSSAYRWHSMELGSNVHMWVPFSICIRVSCRNLMMQIFFLWGLLRQAKVWTGISSTPTEPVDRSEMLSPQNFQFYQVERESIRLSCDNSYQPCSSKYFLSNWLMM